MELLYQDNRILVCLKPPGVRSTDEPGGLPDLLRAQLGDPQASLRTVHRLDQVVGGVMVLARSREAARRLSLQVQDHTFQKEYLAAVHGSNLPDSGTLRDLLLRDRARRRTCVVSQPGKGVQEGILDYRTQERAGDCALVRVTLRTGRTHQIRAQFSAHGHPLLGDQKYGAPEEPWEGIALFSCRLAFRHPQTEEWMEFSCLPPEKGPWTRFSTLVSPRRESL